MIKVVPLSKNWTAEFPSMEEASGFINRVKELGVDLEITETKNDE